MKPLAFALALALAGCDAFYSVRGAVRDPLGKPITGAEVYTGHSGRMDAVLSRPDAYADAVRREQTGDRNGRSTWEMPVSTTDSSGSFDAFLSCGGPFEVWMVVLKPGYVPYHARIPMTWQGGLGRGGVEVILRPQTAAPVAGAGGS